MPAALSFRQVDEKHLLADVELMIWSPKMDLIAVSNILGEVILHRLSWQKVWTLAPISETAKVSSMAWRPDGKVVAIGYNTGRVQLSDVENSSCLHSFQASAGITFLGWMSEMKPNVTPDTTASETKLFQENLSQYLPKLPPFAKSYESKGIGEKPAEDAKKLRDQNELNILMVGMDNGVMELSAFGVFPLGVLDLSHFVPTKVGKVISGHLSSDLSFLSVVVENQSASATIQFFNFDTSILSNYTRELQTLALKLGQILTLESYMDSTLSQMSEAWEDILLEMDSKLLKFAEEKYKIGGGSVSKDFLKLLMFGMPSDELKNFLIFDLTEKGLKKLGHSIENSYSNIQKLLLKHFQSVGQAILSHLSDVKGMSLWPDKFGPLGLCHEKTMEAINRAGSLLLKASELQQVIDGSMKNFKAFFRWLYVVILRLSEEQIPASINKMSQQDLSFVAQFLRDNFTEVEPSKCSFRLEKVGQYLKKEDLTNPIDNSGNPWLQFLENSSTVKDSPFLYRMMSHKSLAQMHQMLRETLDELLHKCAETVGRTFHFISTISGLDESVEPPFTSRISQCNITTDDEVFTYSAFFFKGVRCQRFYVCRQPVLHASSSCPAEILALEPDQIKLPKERTARQQIKKILKNLAKVGNTVYIGLITISGMELRLSNCLVLDLSFYESNTLSLLLQEDCDNGRPILLQVAVSSLEVFFKPISIEGQKTLVQLNNLSCKDVEGSGSVEGFRLLENMKASKFAASGTRKVSCVLFSSRRRVRLFLMDVEDEDEDSTLQVDCSKDEETLDDEGEGDGGDEDESPSSLTVEVDEENKENSSSS